RPSGPCPPSGRRPRSRPGRRCSRPSRCTCPRGRTGSSWPPPRSSTCPRSTRASCARVPAWAHRSGPARGPKPPGRRLPRPGCSPASSFSSCLPPERTYEVSRSFSLARRRPDPRGSVGLAAALHREVALADADIGVGAVDLERDLAPGAVGLLGRRVGEQVMVLELARDLVEDLDQLADLVGREELAAGL